MVGIIKLILETKDLCRWEVRENKVQVSEYGVPDLVPHS